MQKKLKVIFLQPLTLFSNRYDFGNSPLTHLLQIGSYLKDLSKKKGLSIEIKIYNLLEEKISRAMKYNKIEEHIEDLRKFLIQFNDGSDLIFGITVFSTNYYISSMILAKTIKEIYPTSLIFAGGYHVNFFKEDFIFPQQIFNTLISDKLFDYIYLGESDIKFAEQVIELYEKNKTKSNNEQPRVINCGKIDKLDDLPLIDFSLMDYKPTHLLFLNVLFSRGCPYNCNFCGDYRNTDPNFKQNRWRLNSPKQALIQLNHMTQYFEKLNFKFEIHIFDPLFAFPEWRIKLYQGLIESKFDYELWAEVRVDQFSLEKELDYLKKLKFSLAFGVESGNKDMLNIMNKTKNPDRHLERVKNIMKKLEQNNVYMITNFIIGHPGETKKSLEDTLNFAENLFEDSPNGIPSFSKYILTPGSEIYYNMDKYNNNYGSKFDYPFYWKLPHDFFVMAASVEPSINFSHLDVINLAKNRISQLIKKQAKNLIQYNDRDVIYQRFTNYLVIYDYKFWNSIISKLFEIPINRKILLDNAVEFWNFFNDKRKFAENRNSNRTIELYN